MAWITLSEDDLTSVLAGPEIDKIKIAALKLGQDDPIQAALDEAVSECRGYVAACSRNQLGEGETIPSRLKGKVLDIAAHRVLTRVLQVPNGARQSRYDDAQKLFILVSKCQFEVERPANLPDDPLEDGPQYPGPIIGEIPPRQFRRHQMDGM